jgi:hypothetical protein
MNETLPLVTAAGRRRAERRARVKELSEAGHTVREIAEIIGVSKSTVGDDVLNWTKATIDKPEAAPVPSRPPDRFGRTPAPSRVAEFVARAHAAVVEALPALGARELVEFHSRAERVAGHARRLGDGEAERSCQDLCRRLERAISTIGRQG